MTEEELKRLAELLAEKLQQKNPPAFPADGEVDWRKVLLPKFKNRRIQVSNLDAWAFAWLKVVALLINKPLAAIAQTAMLTYINRNMKSHLARLHVVAAREGISLEEAVEGILSGKIKPN